MKKSFALLAFIFASFLWLRYTFSATVVQIGPSSSFESATSDNIDPDRLAGDTIDNDTIDTSGAISASSSTFPALSLYRAANTAAFAQGLHFDLRDSVNVRKTYGLVAGGIVTDTAGAEDGYFLIQLMRTGTLTDQLKLNHKGILGIGTLVTPADGASVLLFGNGTKPSGMSNEAGLFAKDVAGTTEMHSFDEAGNETLISAHAGDAPDWMYDDEDGVPMIVKEAQYFLGTVRYSNQTRADRLLEMTDAEKALLPIEKRRVTFTETFAEHNTRLGLVEEKALVKLDWEAEQDKITEMIAGRKQAIVDRLAAIDVRLAELDVPKAPVETEGLSEEEAAKALAKDAAEAAKIDEERKELVAEKEATTIPDDHVRKSLPKHLDRALKAKNGGK
jgi:hypothetical protein